MKSCLFRKIVKLLSRKVMQIYLGLLNTNLSYREIIQQDIVSHVDKVLLLLFESYKKDHYSRTRVCCNCRYWLSWGIELFTSK